MLLLRFHQCVLLACLVALLGGCVRATVPTVEEGWVPLEEWNQRIVAAPTPRQDATVAQYLKTYGSGSDEHRVRVHTHCYHSRRYTSCSSHTW